jgi:Asp-tRNA(Asn)/Glu-tRNA(Gln) amidotransferase A subunit family amidase
MTTHSRDESMIREFQDHDAVGLAALVASGETTPQELLESAIAQVERTNEDINAVVTEMYDEAARFIEEDLGDDGPLRGVPYLLKDLRADYAGVPTTAGSRFFVDNVPNRDSELVRRIKAAGLVVFGKTNTPEFGGNVSTEPVLFGATRNPWNTEQIAGGSSGGAAAAVAVGMVPAAHASDGGGSIRIPAACCGVFGLKPTRGRNPAGPVFGEAWNGLSMEHAITRTVRDSAAVLDATSGPGVGDPYWAPPPERPYLDEVSREPGILKIAFSVTAKSGVAVDPQYVIAVEQTAAWLEGLGHQVEETEAEYDGIALGNAVKTIIGGNMMAAVRAHAIRVGREPGEEDLEQVIQQRVALGDSLTATDYATAVQTMHGVGRIVGEFMTEWDAVMTPTVARPPLGIGDLNTNTNDVDTFLKNLYGFIPFTAVFNATGQPAMSVPLHQDADGLPIGIQFAGRFGDEATLFRLAGQLEREHPWSARRPTI